MESLELGNYEKGIPGHQAFGLFGCVVKSSDPYFLPFLSLYNKVMNRTAMS